MLDDHYTIKLDGGKYTVISHNYPHGSRLEFLRHGEAWPAGDQLSGAKVVHALVDRIEELEKAIGQVLRGSLDGRGQRAGDGMDSYVKLGPDAERWRERLTAVLGQKP